MRATRGATSSSSSSSLPGRTSAPSNQPGHQAFGSPGEATQLSSSSAAPSSGTNDGPTTAPTRLGGNPLVLQPVSQTSRMPRRTSRTETSLPADKSRQTYDPDHYNPDGSLRTMHKMPHFEQSYAQAMQARYIRHSRPVEREKELTVQQIFDKK